MAETVQPAPETDEKKSRGLESYVVWVFVAVSAYVLSSGPVMKFAGKHVDAIRFAYGPLLSAYQSTPLRKPLLSYWHLWVPHIFEHDGNPFGR